MQEDHQKQLQQSNSVLKETSERGIFVQQLLNKVTCDLEEDLDGKQQAVDAERDAYTFNNADRLSSARQVCG